MATYTLTSVQLRGAGIYNSFEIPAGGGSSFASTNSFVFDGTDDYVNVADSSNLSFGDSVNDSPFSISAWIKFDTTGTTFNILDSRINCLWNIKPNIPPLCDIRWVGRDKINKLNRNINIVFQDIFDLLNIAKRPVKINAIGINIEEMPKIWIKTSDMYDPGKFIKLVESSSEEVFMLWSNLL